MNDIIRALYHSSLYGLVIASVAISGFTDTATTEDGLEHYAEKPWHFLHSTFPWLEYVPMPLNTLVNVLYVFLGVICIYELNVFAQEHPNVFTKGDLYMSYMFPWMSILYAHIQFIRIVTQRHRAAILDQWYTLPILMWAACMCSHVLYGWSVKRTLTLIRISTMSYGLALVHPLGFDVALGAHILLACFSGIRVIYSLDFVPYGMKAAFWKTLFSCVGFVVLKVLDHTLPDIHPVFLYISGHFLSKVCDSLQFYYAFHFFFELFKHRAISTKSNKRD